MTGHAGNQGGCHLNRPENVSKKVPLEEGHKREESKSWEIRGKSILGEGTESTNALRRS